LLTVGKPNLWGVAALYTAERPEFGMAVFHKRVNRNIRLESFKTLNCSLSEDYEFSSAVGSVLA
jgi:hypothetical protein